MCYGQQITHQPSLQVSSVAAMHAQVAPEIGPQIATEGFDGKTRAKRL